MSAQLRAAKYVLASFLGALACDQVLGIEDAYVDRTIGGSGGQASTNGGTGNGFGGNDAVSRGGGVTSGGSVSPAQSSGGLGPAIGEGGADTGAGGSTPTGAGGTPTGEGGTAGAGGAPASDTLCEQYCDIVTAYCTGESLQYKDRDQCLKVCELFPDGVIGGVDGNTVSCRLKYAGKARYAGGTELNAYCRQAGPGGDARCGSNCDGFCTIMMGTCTSSVTEFYSYSTAEACQTDCRTLPEVPFEYGALSTADGNSVGCRLFHVISAVMADPEEHCEHARGITLCEGASP